MTIYKVIDEHNNSIYAFKTLEVAQQEVEMLNKSAENHHYSVEPVEIAETLKA